MKRVVSWLLFLLPLAALGDGMVVPTIAYPAKVTIPDQQLQFVSYDAEGAGHIQPIGK